MLLYYGINTRRGKDLSDQIKGEYYYTTINFRSGGISKVFDYIISSLRDFIFLLKWKPRIIIVEFAQSNLMLIIAHLVKLFIPSTKVIADCHTATYIPESKLLIGFNKSKKILIDKSNAVILHNEETKELNLHNTQFVIESRIPEKNNTNNREGNKNNTNNITFITSFNPDEPIDLIIAVSKCLGSEYKINLTGNYKKVDQKIFHELPPNITLTGFLSIDDYYDLINNSLVLVVLTKRDYTLLYGGREAIAYNVPAVLSNNRCNRSYFNKGIVFVNNTKEDIIDGINKAIDNQELLKNELDELHIEKINLWDRRIGNFNKYLNSS